MPLSNICGYCPAFDPFSRLNSNGDYTFKRITSTNAIKCRKSLYGPLWHCACSMEVLSDFTHRGIAWLQQDNRLD
jgi:hypothetical protein